MTGCRHCGRVPATRPRRLCRTCYQVLSVRNRYPTRGGPTDKIGLGTGNTDPPPCPEPTAIRPGPAKVAILAARAEAGVSLWHPRDTRGNEM